MAQRPKDLPVYRAIAARIEEMVANEELELGATLPPELELAQRFGVNRSTIRESIRLLEDTGFVTRISPRKLTASLPSVDKISERTSRVLGARRISVRELFEFALAIEPAIARSAAQRASDDERRALRENVESTRAALESQPDVDALDERFHHLIGVASHNDAFRFAREPNASLFMPMIRMLTDRLETRQRLITAHDRIVEAIERRDAEVAELWMRRHLLDFERGFALVGLDLDVTLDIHGRLAEP